MGLAASLVAFIFACAAAAVALMMGFSFFLAALAYSGVGATSLVVIVFIADTLQRMSEGPRLDTDVEPAVTSPIQ